MMNSKVKILFPVDFSELSVVAFETAQYLTQAYDAELFLLHVIEAPSGAAKLFSSFDEDSARKQANKMLTKFIEEKGDKSLTINPMVKIGKPYRKIIEAAGELFCDTIVMGTHGTEGMLQDMLVGSNASRVIKAAPCPVLSIREKPEHESFKKIMLPIDLTLETGEKIDVAIELAQHFKSEIVVMSVDWDKDEEIKQRLKKRLDKAVEHIKKHDIEVSSALVVAPGEDISSAVIKYGESVGADLICIMTQQEINFKEAFMGSNAGKVVNHSRIPVYAIKPQKEYKSNNFSGSHFG